MSNKVLVIAPHPDDETLGCGGTILKHKANGDNVHWLIVTNYNKQNLAYNERQLEIEKVAKLYSFDSLIKLNIETTTIDQVSITRLIDLIKTEINKIEPNIIYIPFLYDIHTDHQNVANAMLSFSKWFRYPFIKQINMYETISETNFNFKNKQFNPNLFINISDYMEKKKEIAEIYSSEMKNHPFPRSIRALESNAIMRGSASGYEYAEAFQILIKRQ